MNAPDRSNEVRELVAAHPEIFTAERHDEHRRRFLPTICATLNDVERLTGNPEEWGVLVKRDRTPWVIPADVIVWRLTGEHFDVMTGTGAAWQPRGPIQDQSDEWRWADASVVAPDGSSTPIVRTQPPLPESPALPQVDEQVERFLDALERIYDGLAGIGEGLAALDRRVAALQQEGLRMRFK